VPISLFSLFLNDLEETFILNGYEGVDLLMFQIFILLYADDIVLFAVTPQALQCGFEILSSYCQKWQLKVNVNKTKVIVFRKAGPLARNIQFTYNNENIEIVSNISYLGVVFTSGGSFNQTQITLAGQARKAIFKMKKYLYTITNITVSHQLELFDKLVKPILNYGCEVWGFHKAQNIERLHTQFCKNILGVKRATQNDFVYCELGQHSLIVSRYFKIVKYWFKIIESKENKYIKLIYNIMKHDFELTPSKKNWVSSLHQLLSSLGFLEVWIHQGVGQKEVFLSLFKQRIKDCFYQDMNSRLTESSRALFYRHLNINNDLKMYLTSISNENHRIALSKLRVSSHRLIIESGRWHKPIATPYNERKCTHCQKIDDEYHFILECSLLNDLRKKYIDKKYWLRPNMQKCIALINSQNALTLRKLASFTFLGFKVKN